MVSEKKTIKTISCLSIVVSDHLDVGVNDKITNLVHLFAQGKEGN